MRGVSTLHRIKNLESYVSGFISDEDADTGAKLLFPAKNSQLHVQLLRTVAPLWRRPGSISAFAFDSGAICVQKSHRLRQKLIGVGESGRLRQLCD